MSKIMELIGSGKRLSGLLNIAALAITQAAESAGYETDQVTILSALNGVLVLVGIAHAFIKKGA